MKRAERAGGRSQSGKQMKFTINKELGREDGEDCGWIAQDQRLVSSFLLSAPTVNTCLSFLALSLSPLPSYATDCDYVVTRRCSRRDPLGNGMLDRTMGKQSMRVATISLRKAKPSNVDDDRSLVVWEMVGDIVGLMEKSKTGC